MSGRVYARKFDWDEARNRYAAGERAVDLASEYGVTPNAIWRVVIPGRLDRERLYSLDWQRRGRCDECGSPMNRMSRSSGSYRCRECASLAAATTVRPDTLQCTTCKKWKTDDDFSNSASATAARRRRHPECRACNTISRREYRHRNAERERVYSRDYKRRRKLAHAQPVAEDTGKPKTGAGS